MRNVLSERRAPPFSLERGQKPRRRPRRGRNRYPPRDGSFTAVYNTHTLTGHTHTQTHTHTHTYINAINFKRQLQLVNCSCEIGLYNIYIAGCVLLL